jgi:hypothetical protein
LGDGARLDDLVVDRGKTALAAVQTMTPDGVRPGKRVVQGETVRFVQSRNRHCGTRSVGRPDKYIIGQDGGSHIALIDGAAMAIIACRSDDRVALKGRDRRVGVIKHLLQKFLRVLGKVVAEVEGSRVEELQVGMPRRQENIVVGVKGARAAALEHVGYSD